MVINNFWSDGELAGAGENNARMRFSARFRIPTKRSPKVIW
jgi:hypothetical protein